MLDQINPKIKLEKDEYQSEIDELRLEISRLQRRIRNAKIPILFIFEGWDAAGKGTLINDLIKPLDARGYQVFPYVDPKEDYSMRPFLWRYAIHAPAAGRISIFDRSYYQKVSCERLSGKVKSKEIAKIFSDITAFEKTLVDSGVVIFKFFLHISKKTQKKRFDKLMENKATRWRVGKDDLKRHKHYDKLFSYYEEMLERSDTDDAPWTVIEAGDTRHAIVKIMKTAISGMERALESKVGASPTPSEYLLSEFPDDTEILSGVDLEKKIDPDEYKERLDKSQKKLYELQHKLYLKRIPLMILYEGWDAAGKGGNIRRVTDELDPRGYEVVPVAAPNDIEKAHHYLWRFWNKIPKAGHITLFDRTWYGRVLVERVEGFCDKNDWKRAYHEINHFERHLSDFGTIIVKFWLQISPEEQLRRFKAREENPDKQWKITDEDWRNREKWALYEKAVEEMIYRTSTAHAPWTIIESNSKHYARIKALETIIEAIEKQI